MNPPDAKLFRRERRRFLRLSAAALPAGAGLLAGCSALVPGQTPPPELYRLTPKSTFDLALPTVDWQLVIAQPSADAALDSTRIALLRDPTRVEYYARAGWIDRATVMVQTLILKSFENSGRIVSVGRRAIGLRADFELLSELRAFQAEYFSGRIEVRVSINAKLVDAQRRSIVAQDSFEATAPVGQDSLPVIVYAFDEALGKVMKRLVEWTLVTAQDYWVTEMGDL